MFTERARSASAVLVGPIARGLGRLGISPDALTVVGLLLHIPVAWVLYQGHMVAGAALLAFSAAVDGIDGAVARATGKTTLGGAFLDSVLDRISEIIVFGGVLGYALQTNQPQMAALAYLAVTGSLMVSYTRARSEGLGLDTRVGILGRFERMLLLVVGLALELVIPTLAVLGIGAWVTAVMRMVDVHGRGGTAS